MVLHWKIEKKREALTKSCQLESIWSRPISTSSWVENVHIRDGGEIKGRGEEMMAWRNRGEIRRPPRYISPLVFWRPKRDGSWFNSLETWDESIFPGAIIVGVEAIYGEHVKIQNYKNILVAPYQPIAAALVSNVPTFTYKQRRELACN